MFQLVFWYWLSWVADTYLEKILFTMISLGYSNCLVSVVYLAALDKRL